ncbi:translation protein SH3-like domain-containing protein [Cyathus striatus]|nr:translation protein SH3-like domain-containing protein [Cyathus striatus]
MLSNTFFHARRFLSTKVSLPSAPVIYPFSKTALTPSPTYTSPPAALQEGKGLMEFIQKTLLSPEKQAMLDKLFSRRSPNRITPGSVVTVVSEQAPTVFTGIVLSIRRRGIDTSFLLRNIINRTGVEMQYFPSSPHIKEIRVVRRPAKRMRRAKLFYLRDSPQKMSMLAK